jgi:hypothetical protein
MQQPDLYPKDERIVVVHMAESWTEAVVVRGLLESAGIPSPALGDGNPSPLPDLAAIFHGIEIYALESQAAQARQVIAEYLAGAGSALDLDDTPDVADET